MIGGQETLLEFPCQFPIKVMGRAEPNFDLLVLELVRRHAPNLQEGALSVRTSRGGRWVSVTVVVDAESREQLEAIYLELSAHDKIVWAL